MREPRPPESGQFGARRGDRETPPDVVDFPLKCFRMVVCGMVRLMRRAESPSWEIRVNRWNQSLDCALWFRAAERRTARSS